jgi:hypothetical protein
LFVRFCTVSISVSQVTEAREREARADLDELQGRHVGLKTKMKSLALAYRNVACGSCLPEITCLLPACLLACLIC